ncbi:MAG: hypothetical protein QW791_08820 [Candidatus Bathyarchaeia archaeon]
MKNFIELGVLDVLLRGVNRTIFSMKKTMEPPSFLIGFVIKQLTLHEQRELEYTFKLCFKRRGGGFKVN